MIVGGILTPLEDALESVLEWLHTSIGLPWAWSIVALTVIVRILIVPLTVRQIHSMQNMQRHMPEMKEIQRKYKHDKQRQREELMQFYKENQINPASSCLPLLAQFPIFIALFFVLRDFAENPPPGSLSWLGFVPSIADEASSHWTGAVLLVIYIISQTASTWFMSATMDRTQRWIMMVLPIVFVTFLVNFPTGLVLYWMTTNLWTVGQGLITRRLVPKTAAPSPRRSSRAPRKDEPDDDGDGARPTPAAPKKPPAAAQPPRRVKRKKKARR